VDEPSARWRSQLRSRSRPQFNLSRSSAALPLTYRCFVRLGRSASDRGCSRRLAHRPLHEQDRAEGDGLDCREIAEVTGRSENQVALGLTRRVEGGVRRTPPYNIARDNSQKPRAMIARLQAPDRSVDGNLARLTAADSAARRAARHP